MISPKAIATLRSIAQAKDDYATIKQLLAATDWKIDEDETDLGFLRIFIPDPNDKSYRLIIGYRDPDHPPYSILTFHLFPDKPERIADFNSAFNSVVDFLKQTIGAPTSSGSHQLTFRSWPYSYHRWSLPEAEFTLVQDEFDIQDGLDVTLWIQPVGTPINETLHLTPTSKPTEQTTPEHMKTVRHRRKLLNTVWRIYMAIVLAAFMTLYFSNAGQSTRKLFAYALISATVALAAFALYSRRLPDP